ncbi:MAG TPA: Hsp20/alpha crystallin family protein [Streptosporangiaceae bacterium]|nr:Hsp20/alpha crystallin family protein [Streptosporangiaceae bacterium]
MSAPQRRERGLLPDLLDWLESPFAALRPAADQTIRVEDYVTDNAYIVRAELPGIDPEKDVEITVTGNLLRIHAERHVEQQEAHRSEFRYGSFTRSLTLPEGVEAADVKADYNHGILEITVPLPETKREVHRIQVTAGE